MTHAITILVDEDTYKALLQTREDEYIRSTLGVVASDIIKEHYQRKDKK